MQRDLVASEQPADKRRARVGTDEGLEHPVDRWPPPAYTDLGATEQ